jgi:YgiT-type zinc finger domain-containing protein
MTGELGRNNRCPLCGGRLEPGLATIPFILPGTVVLIKDVPAEICSSCNEPYTAGRVTDRIVYLLNQVRSLHTEISVIPYTEPQPISSSPTAVRV